MSAHDDLKQRLLATFRVEADEHLRTLTANLIALEQEPPPERSRELTEATFRAMHTLKGAARSVGLMDVDLLCNACESLLSRMVRAQLPVTRELLALLEEAVAGISDHVAGKPADPHALADRLRAAGGEDVAHARIPAAPPSRPSTAAALEDAPAVETIRLDATKLDALLLQGEELLVAKHAFEERMREARVLVAELARSREALSHPSATALAEAPATSALRDAEARARALFERLARDRQTVGVAVDGLLDEMRRTRMMPASTVIELFPGMVREIAREQGKEVGWSARGGDLELDRRVLETVKSPLVHLVRNAVDHGIEPPAERLAAGKRAQGRLAVTVSALEDGRVEILVEDDGRGIDIGRVREAGVRARVVTAEAAAALPDADALELVYHSGLSTSPVISAISGHGLGLAIVREEVQRLEGSVTLDSRPGAGTRARLVIPATIATFRGLLVRSAGQEFLVPLAATEHVLALARGDIRAVEAGEAISWNGEPTPVARLDAVLGLSGREGGGRNGEQRCVIAAVGPERVALLVDDVLGEEEVLVKDLSPPLVHVRHVAGAAVLRTGQVALILRAADLVATGRQARRPAAPAPVRAAQEERAPLVLVVDDAVTTRTMERSLLEGAGYRVEVAVDGVDAWTALRSGEFDLVVSDVDMPRMDGFELTARIRGDQRLADLPVVLVSALEAREDKERGIAVGANAYVVKSSFEQSNLLEIIRRLGVVPPQGGRP